jgi:hypothetical protein
MVHVRSVCLAVTLTSGAFLSAQTTSPPAQTPTTPPAQTTTPPKPEVLKPQIYVRRISLGATLSVVPMTFIPEKTENVLTATPPVDALHSTTPITKRVGYGATVNLALTGRFALNGSLLIRQIGYKMNSDIHEGFDNPLTIGDDRRFSARKEETRAKLVDLPIVLRFYGKDRTEPGPRWFFEAGGALRRVRGVRTSVETTTGSAAPVCCDLNPAPSKHTIKGVVGGAGVQLIDPVGIRVIPEVRYTRWMGETFHSLTTITQRNQVEAMISLTF